MTTLDRTHVPQTVLYNLKHTPAWNFKVSIQIKLIYIFMYSLNFCPGPKGHLVLSSVSLCTVCLCVGCLVERVWFGIDLAIGICWLLYLHNTLYNYMYVDVSMHVYSENIKDERERESEFRETCVCDVWVWCVCYLMYRLLQSIFNKNRAEKRSFVCSLATMHYSSHLHSCVCVYPVVLLFMCIFCFCMHACMIL